MAKKFVFDDEDQLEITEVNDVKPVESNTIKVEEPTIIVEKNKDPLSIEDLHLDTVNTETEESSKKESFIKRMLHMKWRWWHYLLFGLLVLCLLFAGYIYSVTNTDGPVYGNRCEGVVSIPLDAKTSTIENMRKEYEEIEALDIEVACRQIKFDISFKEGTKTKTCIKITEEVIKAFDKEVGYEIPEGKTFSNLFGSIDNESQYEINVYLQCTNNEVFPVYGTKHTQRDEITYTYNKIADQDSYDKAVSTLEEDE